MENSAIEISSTGKEAFEQGDFDKAVDLFDAAAEAYIQEGNLVDAAEAKNNLSVALLQTQRAEESLKAALETDVVFEEANDPLRQAMALGNQAAALDALGRLDEALALYESSAALFGGINEKDYQATVLKSIAGIKLRKGKFQDTAYTMLDSLGAAPKPNIFQRILKFFLRLIR
ncbi:MAG: tetratricopeptide repeat protein [Anaerolineae bacterium]|jgi:tetratricopeptide (TPR) repeat protein|nr:tetratricopeptide repeat protein [Anaerolineae bacterium]MBT7601767.1 tetratricopeptide repeat protein [Anaerolineae bacterium]